jgi:hypothetical protein
MTEQTAAVTEEEQIQRALKAIEEFDPSTAKWEDASDLRAISQARDAVRRANVDLAVAVHSARLNHGRSWGMIAIQLGVSRQAARERWAPKIGDARDDVHVSSSEKA